MTPTANSLVLVGAGSVLGTALKDRLAAAGYPGSAVQLLEDLVEEFQDRVLGLAAGNRGLLEFNVAGKPAAGNIT